MSGARQRDKVTRKEALKLLGGGLAAAALGTGFAADGGGQTATALGVEFTAEALTAEAEALGRIKTGVFPYPFANPDEPTLAGGFRAFANGVNHKPFYFAAWTDYTKPQAGALYDWYDQDILQVVETLGVHLYLSLDVKPKEPEYSFRDLWRGCLRPRAWIPMSTL